MPTWPYPFWIAHRGAGTLAPENTRAAIREGARHGFRMCEFDVRCARDGMPFLLHDPTLDRTTDGRGPVEALDWPALAERVAGRWHSPAYAGEPIPTLAEVAAICRELGLCCNVEIKTGPGDAERSGALIARAASSLWRSVEPPPLLSSFDPLALAAAMQAAPELPRALLVNAPAPGWLERIASLRCVSLHVSHRHVDGDLIEAAHAAGCRVLAYTVNDEASAGRLIDAGIDGLFTDALQRLGPMAAVNRRRPVRPDSAR
ncbi:MAG: glycerophosphodiester phosphodiesterase [Burkholderiales bacterium]|nr:MAG: glycerophosphodiester phosphodiesterase [Burkholderiales bacterium]